MELLPKRMDADFFFKGEKLQPFVGDRSDSRQVGRNLIKQMQTAEECQIYCISPRKSYTVKKFRRKAVTRDDCDFLRGFYAF